ncbi:MAG: ABC transporter permease [Muribaculaceae bacterium]|nr:ABC transporter permease [Muribaculaceae bacterium]
MKDNKIGIIIGREYSERVKKKSFILTTIAVPLLMVLLMILPAAIMLFASGDEKTIAVVDDSGIVLPALKSTDEVRFIAADASPEEMLAAKGDGEIYGVLVINRNIVQRPNGLKLLTSNAASIAVENAITSQVEDIIETEKLKKYDIENLDKILEDVHTTVTLQTIRTSDDGEEGESQSAAISSAIGTVLNFLLYMFLLMYGSLVMNSIIEEKNNRVLEIVVSSIKPTQLLLGKIIGVGLVAITQIAIWGVILTTLTSVALPALIPADMMAEASAITSGNSVGSDMDLDLAIALSMFTNVGYVLRLLGFMVLFLIGGYLIYASIFACIGAAVDNIQDASQLQMLGMAPIIIALIASMAVITEPNGTFAVVMSMIPVTSPMVMMARIPFDIPAWEIVLSLVILAVSVIFTIWFAAKVYRVGIFMYGKKPTIRDLIRWARYK